MSLTVSIRLAAALVLAGILCNLPLHAQLSMASVNGTIRDTTGSVIPEAEVILRNLDTGVERRSTTNVAGIWVLPNVPPGRYTLRAGKSGFATQELAPFTLVVNQTASFDTMLQLGSVEQSVTVEAVGAEVQASTAELGAAVTRQSVLDLPLNGRNFTQLLALTPGVAPVNVSQAGAAAAVGTFVLPSVNGQQNRSNLFTTDGIINQQAVWSLYGTPPIVDAIEEFKVQSHNDQAEFGGVTGGVVNVVTKSGTNELHGSLWEYLRNDALDARNFFQPSVTPFKQHMFGASSGGPVVLPRVYDGHNRTFFFLAYQGFRFRRPAERYYRVPTPANLNGDLSDWPRQIYNPYTTRPDPSRPGNFLRDPFPGNVIPASLIDPAMLLYAKSTLPAPAATGLADRNALDPTQTRQSQEEYTARVDQTIGRKDFLWFRYSGRLLDRSGSGGRQAVVSAGEHRSKNFGLNWVHTFGPSAVLQAQFGRIRVRDDSFNRFRSLPADFIKQVGFSDQFCCRFVQGFADGRTLVPALNVSDFFSGGESVNPLRPADIYQYKANLSKVRGSHTFKLGGEMNSSDFASGIYNPSVSFQSVQTNNPQQPGTTGSPLASYLLNIPDSAGYRNRQTTMRWGGVMGFYFQDQWKATQRLSVNLGLRYDRTFIPPFGRTDDPTGNIYVGNWDLSRGVYLLQAMPPSCEQRKEAPCIPGGALPKYVELDPRGKLLHDTTRNFQPRIGLAYRLRSKTALRASFGIFFDNWAGVIQTAQNVGGNWPSVSEQSVGNLNTPAQDRLAPNVKAQRPFLEGQLPDPNPYERAGIFTDPYFKNAYSMQWNLGVQHQVNPTTLVSLNYVGSGGRRLDLGGYWNVARSPGPGNPRDRTQYPYITPLLWYDRSWGRSNYNALQVLLDKKYAGGFAYMAAYTWSKSIDTACSGWYSVEGCAIQDPIHFNNDRSVSAYDLTQVLTLSWVYQLPVGPGKRLQTGSRVADHILGNWQLNGITTLRSGLPYTLAVNGDIANIGAGGTYMRPVVVGKHELSNASPELWFNKAAFASPAPFTFGNLGRNRLRTDWLRNFDLSVFRQFPLGESRRLELRAEAFNAFNTPTFGTPTTNMSSPNFGRVFGTGNSPRQLQLGLKLAF